MEAHEDRLLSTEQVGERWGISPTTISRARQAGNGVPFVKIGSRVRYRLSDIVRCELTGVDFAEPIPDSSGHALEVPQAHTLHAVGTHSDSTGDTFSAPGDHEVVEVETSPSGLFAHPKPKDSRSGKVSW